MLSKLIVFEYIYILNGIPCMRETVVVVHTYVWASKNSSTPPRSIIPSRNRVALSRWRNYSQGLIVPKTYFLITTYICRQKSIHLKKNKSRVAFIRPAVLSIENKNNKKNPTILKSLIFPPFFLIAASIIFFKKTKQKNLESALLWIKSCVSNKV